MARGRGAAARPRLHRGRSVHHRRHCARRLRAALVRRRRRDQAEAAEHAALVRACLQASRICEIYRTANVVRRYWRTNFTPTVRPRHHTTSQGRPPRASRVNARRNLAGSVLLSSTVILAPDEERSSTTQARAAKPPSSVIQPGWRSDLRASRLFAPNLFSPVASRSFRKTQIDLREADL